LRPGPGRPRRDDSSSSRPHRTCGWVCPTTSARRRCARPRRHPKLLVSPWACAAARSARSCSASPDKGSPLRMYLWAPNRTPDAPPRRRPRTWRTSPPPRPGTGCESHSTPPARPSQACSRLDEGTNRRAREGNWETTLTPARPAHIRTPALRTSHFPDPPSTIPERRYLLRLDTEGSQVRMSARSLSKDERRAAHAAERLTCRGARIVPCACASATTAG
jgi:hypothetical protein